MQQILRILQSNDGDMSSCLSNCSNKGMCLLNSQMQKYLCECDEYFTGVSCQTDTRPCARSNKCLNNGTCINSFNSTSFTCECQADGLYYGQYCENIKNLCENVKCSSHGYCAQIQSDVQCKCFKGYEGKQCETESFKIKSVKKFKKTATIN